MHARTSLIVAATIATALTASVAASAQELAPPPPMPPEEPESHEDSRTERDLDDSQKSDSKRGLEWFYADAQGGVQIVGLRTFNLDEADLSADFIPTESQGFVMSAGVGLRLMLLTFGARARVGLFDAWDLFSIGGEVGLHLPFGNLEPHFELGGGYTALGSFESSLRSGAVKSALDNTDIAGFYIRAGGGVDYYITPMISIGAVASLEVLGLTRPGLDPSKITEIKDDPTISDLQKKKADLLAFEGTSYGAAGTAMGVLGVHF